MLKDNPVKGIIREIAVIIKAQIPYWEDPRALVIIGICIMPSTTMTISPAIMYTICLPKIVYS
jgi:hypothetical protein